MGGYYDPPLVPSAKFKKNRCLTLLSQGLQDFYSRRHFGDISANFFGKRKTVCLFCTTTVIYLHK